MGWATGGGPKTIDPNILNTVRAELVEAHWTSKPFDKLSRNSKFLMFFQSVREVN